MAGKSINKLQLEAVVSKIEQTLKQQDNLVIKNYKESFEKGKMYKKFCKIYEERIALEKKKDEISKLMSDKAKELYDMIPSGIDGYNRSFYSSDFDEDDFTYRKSDLVRSEMQKANLDLKSDNFNRIATKNDLLIQSIDPEFNIELFIEKYSK